MIFRTSIFLWITVGFLSLSVKSKACESDGFPSLCDFVLKEVCFDLVWESRTWSEARSSCEQPGGTLLNVLNNEIKILLKNTPQERSVSNFTFWVGKEIQEKELNKESTDVSKENCTYMKLKPLQLISTSDCNQPRGFLCTHSLWSSRSTKRTSLSAHATRSRLKRSTIETIYDSLKRAEEELERMEQTPLEPTHTKRDEFIETLLETTQSLTEDIVLMDRNITNHILNCSSAILSLSMTRCDVQSNPNPQSLFEQVFEIFRLISLLLGKTTPGPLTVKHPTGTLYQNRYKPADLSNTVLGSKERGEYVRFSSFEAMKPQIGAYSTVIAQLTTFSKNPHPSDENISGPVFSVILSDGDSDIKLANLTEMIEIVIPRSAAPSDTNNSVVLEENKIALNKLNISDPYMTIFFTVKPNYDVSLAVMLAYRSPPNSTHFSNQTVLTKTGGYRWIITPEMLQGRSGIWFVELRLYNSTWVPGLTLDISSFMSKCMFWDKEPMKWSSDGCQVGEKSSVSQTQCLCNHLTLFGSSFFVMPNDVDVSRTAELFATVTENYVVLALLCAFFGLYLVTLLWACYADRRARFKRKMTLLEDCHPGALYNYLISVQTGNRKNAGTTANVTVKLIGSEGESETHNLTDPDKLVFERGSVDVFVLATPFPLGEVRSIRLQHNNAGGHPSWYINRVTIQDLQTRHVWHYLCGCWLSADRGDGLTKKTFNAAKNNEIASFRDIFQSRTSTGFRDEHIWVSIVDPPSRSPFTRAQRVSCCMSLLLCTMAINIAFWNLPVDEASPVVFSMGSMNITWQEIMVGIQSGLLMFPINILIITIFRSIKPRISSKPKKEESEEDMKPPAFQATDILKDIEEVISLLSKCPRNNISMVGALECSADLCPALQRVHEFIHLMQGESESNPHWVHCSQFLLAGLCHLVMCLEKLDSNNFLNPYNYNQTLDMAYHLVRKAEMVFSSHVASCPPPVKIQKKRRSGGCWLPWWFVFLGWFLLLSISGVSTFFTLLYGFEYGREKSIKWVMSLGLSLFQSIFILQPLKVIGIAVFFALLLKPVAVEESEEVEQVLLVQQEKCRRYTGRATL